MGSKRPGNEPAVKGGIKKLNLKAKSPLAPAASERQPGTKPTAVKGGVDFLKQRLGQKVRELRPEVAAGAGAGQEGDSNAAAGDLRALQAEASRRGTEFERDAGCQASEDTACASTNRGSEAENTRRRFYTELRKVIAAADIIVEVLDARDPGACRCLEVERNVSSAGKRLVLLLNKIDLVPKHAVEAWMNHLKRSFPAIAFKAAQGNAHRPVHAMANANRASEGLLRSTHAVVGADELMQLLKNYARMGGGREKAHLSVGIIGYPNTGKSSVINSMKRHAAVDVGGRAGVTKVMQEVQLDNKVTLIDSPGVVFEGASKDPSVVLRNVVRVENVIDPIGVVEALVKKAPREALLQFYNMEKDFEQVNDFLFHVARARGKLRRGSFLDVQGTARSVISDWTAGKFRYFVLPPQEESNATARAAVETAEVVRQLAPRLDIDALCGGHGAAPAVLGAPPRLQAGGEDPGMDVCEERPGAAVEVDMAAMD